ncbi:helix-turn-helix transcriptional regulator [Amycolatopsis sp. DSM 110486]|uniref:helix-turn-helix transcriptional regulator n=1 Tax=Amycolatopsis sp. DSM 110486 TaxID=2865832 RepID=UPI001C69E778|nr:helix-turn-helix transcriptional regulator [Amycolatopsis sp. DSM 110486]QYN26676.1 PadR family transcriptional regulator [Amycolatopsis sp. DSM 110486]
MRTAREMDKLASAFLGGGQEARFSAADLRAAVGVHNARLYPLLQTMRQRGWITDEWPKTDPFRPHCYMLTERGREELSDA